jgi:hypothetical protein
VSPLCAVVCGAPDVVVEVVVVVVVFLEHPAAANIIPTIDKTSKIEHHFFIVCISNFSIIY